MSDAPGSLMSALLAVQAKLPSLTKDATAKVESKRTGKSYTYRYIGLDTVMEAVLPVLNLHKLVWVTLPEIDERGEPVLTYRLVHAETGEAITGTMALMLAERDSRAQGSAITYARRYSLMSVLGLVADEDDDGAAASRRAQPKQAAAPSNGQTAFASEQDVIEIREAAKGLQPDQIKLALAVAGVPSGTPSERIPREKVVSVIKALGMSERTP